MMMNIAYAEGKARAEEDFGLRTAADSFQRAIPHGDMNVPAERLAKHLSVMDPGVASPKEEKRQRFGNPVRWGDVSTPHGTGASSFDYANVGPDQAAI
jgi:hypothetical protein